MLELRRKNVIIFTKLPCIFWFQKFQTTLLIYYKIQCLIGLAKKSFLKTSFKATNLVAKCNFIVVCFKKNAVRFFSYQYVNFSSFDSEQ